MLVELLVFLGYKIGKSKKVIILSLKITENNRNQRWIQKILTVWIIAIVLLWSKDGQDV